MARKKRQNDVRDLWSTGAVDEDECQFMNSYRAKDAIQSKVLPKTNITVAEPGLKGINMFEGFMHHIDKGLGPLNPDWFEELTAKASRGDGGDSSFGGQKPLGTSASCVREGSFKTPSEKSALDSQMFSTPKIFRRRRLQSPDPMTKNEEPQSPIQGTPGLAQTLPWTDSSPCLFGSAKDSPPFCKPFESRQQNEHFGLLDTPKSYTAYSAKLISESLGAQLNPDVSWTSSLNTPSSLTPTVILPKPDDHTSPESLPGEVIFVRKLFPSFSKNFGSTVSSEKRNGCFVQQGEGNCQADGLGAKIDGSQDTSLGNMSSFWKQTVPDAIEDRDVRNAVGSVLDGAEDVLSIFFSNSSSALRRVKTRERIKRRLSSGAKDISSTPPLTLNTESLQGRNETSMGDMHAKDTSATVETRSPLKSTGCGITQWTPLSLSDISDTTVEPVCPVGSYSSNKHITAPSDGFGEVSKSAHAQPHQRDSCSRSNGLEFSLSSVEKQRSFPNSLPEASQFPGSSLGASSALSLTIKPRKFVYCIQSPHPPRQATNHSTAQPTYTSPAISIPEDFLNAIPFQRRAPLSNEAKIKNASTHSVVGESHSVQQGSATDKNLVPTTLNNEHDFDMTQLCRAFAEDFSQEVDSKKSFSKCADVGQSGFSASACLAAMRQRNRKLQTIPEDQNEAVVKQLDKPTTENESINITNLLKIENTACKSQRHDSGYPTTFSDLDRMTGSTNIVSCYDRDTVCQSHSGFKTANNRIISLPQEAVMKALLDEFVECNVTDTITPKEKMSSNVPGKQMLTSTSRTFLNHTIKPEGKNTEKTSNGRISSQKSTHQIIHNSFSSFDGSGFKTASNRSINVSSMNLHKAKEMFKEMEDEKFSDKSSSCGLVEMQLMEVAEEENHTSKTLLDLKSTYTHPVHQSNQKPADADRPLTASQKADVSELCSLLEDADSQYEFTQFKPAKPSTPLCHNNPSHQPDKKEWDPDILTGIDFDDSFSSDVEKQVAKRHQMKTDTPHKLCTIPHGKTNGEVLNQSKASGETSSRLTEKMNNGVGPISRNTERRSTLLLPGRNAMPGSLSAEITSAKGILSNMEESKAFSVRFKTARGDVLSISEKCLSKARNVFADLEENQESNTEIYSKGNDEVINSVDESGSHMKLKTSMVSSTIDNTEFMLCGGTNKELNMNHQGNLGGGATNAVKDFEVNMHDITNSATKQEKGVRSEFTHNTSGKSNCGFSTAGGKKMHASEKALLKARTFQNECTDLEDTESGKCFRANVNTPNSKTISSNPPLKTSIECGDTSLPTHETGIVGDAIEHLNTVSNDQWKTTCGFSTASGKKVSVSEGALLKAKTLFNDGDEIVEDRFEVNFTKSLIQNPQRKPNSGFKTASGKGVTVSAKALQEAKAVFKDTDANIDRSSNTETKEGKTDLKSDCIYNNQDGCKQKHGDGFKTASGKGVSVSAKALQETKAVFKDCDANMDCSSSAETKQENENFKSDYSNPEKTSCGFSTAGGKRVHVSEKALMKARTLLSESAEEDTTGSNKCLAEFPKTSVETSKLKSNSGFNTASGKRVSITAKALQESKAVFSDCGDASFCENGAEMKQETSKNSKTDPTGLGKGCGFSTASGKRVSVSDRALQKAKNLLNECSDVEHLQSEKSLIVGLKTSTQDPQQKGCLGFSTASDKGVAISEKAVKEVKAVFAGCDDTSSERDGIARKHLNASNKGPQGSNCGTSTSSDKRGTMSERVPLDTEVILGEFVHIKDGESLLSKPGVSHFGFSTASGKGVSVSKKALTEAFEKFKECDDAQLNENTKSDVHRRPHETKASVGTPTIGAKCLPLQTALEADHKVKQANISGCSFPSKNVSVLDVHPLGLSGCTVTQQRYFEQEAMACTKALLEDEDLTEQSLHATLEETIIRDGPINQGLQCKRSTELNRVIGKRMSEDANLKDQPPLKRRLLAEFDRASDCTKQHALTPVKSCPNGTLKDRRVFKYNVPLQPNVTRPYRATVDQKSNKPEPLIATSDPALRNSKPSNSKMAAFVPPFRKNPKPGAQKDVAPQEVTKAPGVFVPPFRKKHKVVNKGQDESFPQPQNDSKSTSISEPSVKDDTFVAIVKTLAPVSDPGCERKETAQESKLHSIALNVGVDGQNLSTACSPRGRETDIEMPSSAHASPAHASPEVFICSSTEQTLQCLQLARDMQDMRIRKKKRQAIRPLPGSLFLAKTSGVARISLREAVGYRCPVQHTKEELYQYGVHCQVSQVTSEKAELFRFQCEYFFKRDLLTEGGGIQLADGGWLIPDSSGTVGKEEFYRALCDTPGVDIKLISEAWVHNHYRWIVWKRASMERSFPEVMGSLCLTPEQVLLQLKYRYDMEVDHSRRSALRKIMERDDTSAKTLVLCVCGIATTGQNPIRPSRDEDETSLRTEAKAESPAGVIWLTDGWYAIKALLDIPLTAMLHKGRLAIGGKVVTYGAELVGSQEACPPLEAPESLMLKISANSTRPARWDAKLGFHYDPRPFQLPLSSLYSNGGLVGCVDIMVLRTYPTQWMEKTSGGVYVFRNDRAEEREARRHGTTKQKAMELLFSKIQGQFEKEEDGKIKTRSRRRTLSRQEIEALQDGEELLEAVESDPVCLEAHLSEQQLVTLNSCRHSAGERRQAQLQERFRRALEEAQEGEGSCPNRVVTPMWKLCISDSRDQHSSSVYSLNIWRPSMDLRSLLKEGCRYRAYNLATSEGKKRTGVAAVQLTATKKTQFQDIQVPPEWLFDHFHSRVSASFRDLQNPHFRPPCGEVDVVGYVISMTDRHGSSPVLYLVDEKQDFVSVRSFGSLVQLALEDLAKPLALLALSNLQLRRPSAPIPALYAGELALFSTNPKEVHLQEASALLRGCVQDQEHFFRIAEEKLSNLMPSAGLSSIPSPITPGWKADPKQNGRINMTPQQSVRSFGSFTPMNKRTPLSTSTSEDKDRKSLKRKRGLDYLTRIPSPPPISPLGTLASPCVNKTFNPPRRTETPRPLHREQTTTPHRGPPPVEEEWVKDEELAMINTQALLDGLGGPDGAGVPR